MRSKVLWLFVALLVFAPSLTAGFVWDDHHLIEHDARIHAAPSLGQLLSMPFFPDAAVDGGSVIDAGNAHYYRPLTKAVQALQYQQLGAAPFGYHLFNLALHATNVLLALAWLTRRLGDGPHASLAAALGVIPFALHPSRVLAVTWVSGAGDLLMTLFVLLGLLLWQRRTLRLAAIAALALCSAGATLSKEAGIVLAVALLADTVLLAPRAEWPRRFAALGVVAAVQAGILMLRAAMIETRPSGPLSDGVLALVSRVSVSFGFALKSVVLPTSLRHQLNGQLGAPETLPLELQISGLVGLVAGLALVAFIVRARRTGTWLPAADDLALFAILLAPGLNAVIIGSQGGTLSERYTYAPMLGLSALCARGLARWISLRGARLVTLACCGWAAGYAALCVVEISPMQSDRALYAHFVEQEPTELFSVDGLMREALITGDRALARGCNAHRLCVIAHGLSASTNEVARREGLTAALLAYADVELHLASDAEQAWLEQIRTTLDALAEGQPAALEVGGTVVALDRPAALGTWPAAQAENLTVLRAIARARTLQLQEARALLAQLATPSREALAWRERVTAGLQAAPLDCEAPERALAAVHALAAAGLPALARKRLAECSALPRDAALLAAAELDLIDRRPDLAKERLLQAMPMAGSLAPALQRQLGRLAQHTEAMLAAEAQHAASTAACLPCAQLRRR